ncbi:hypothetical protein [Flexivirga lutea]
MVGRVEWGALEGNEVETVLANLIYNDNSRAVRVRPGQGDFGIDILIPSTEEPVPWDIYQVKKYWQNLTSGQRTKITESFSRLLIGLVRENLKINDWYLVTPLDPTVIKDLKGWFADLPESAIKHAKKLKQNPLTADEEVWVRAWLDAPGRKIEWKGLPFCDNLAADYPYVVDYYVHGGRQRLRDATDSVAGLLAGDMKAREALNSAPGDGSAALLEPVEMIGHLTLLDEVLDTDPHYIYGHAISPTQPDLLEYEPNLVAAAQRTLPNGKWLTFKIYQRSPQSLEERPIPIKLEFTSDGGTTEIKDFETWQKYGRPFEAPARVSVDLPGGLGATDKEGVVSVPALHSSDNYQLRMRIVAPDDEVLAELEFRMTSTVGLEKKAALASGKDPSGALENSGFYEAGLGEAQQVNFTLEPLAGLVAAKVQQAVTFARHLEAPNRIQLAGPVGTYKDLVELDCAEGMVPPSVDRFVSSLATIQIRTAQIIQIPDITEMTKGDVKKVHRAAALIDGSVHIATWDRAQIHGVDPGTISAGEHLQIQMDIPLNVTIDGTALELGTVEQTVVSGTVVSVDGTTAVLEPNLNDTVYERLIEAPRPGDAPVGNVAVRCRPYPEAPSDPAAE